MKTKKIFTLRVSVLVVFLLLMLVAINPNPFAAGLEVKTVRGEAATNGLKIGDVIESINGEAIETIEEFNEVISNVEINETFIIQTKKSEVAYITTERPDISIREVRKNNIEKGLDLSGGTRVLLRPDVEHEVSDQQIKNLIDILNNRLNTYGLSDLQIRKATDKDKNKLVLIEIAGASRKEVEELIAGQGKFEAKIDNKTVFEGSKEDIPFVCKDDGTCSGVMNCDGEQNDFFCTFEFAIGLSAEAAKKHAEITKGIPLDPTTETDPTGTTKQYLNATLDLYLDDKLVDSLRISEGLKGIETTSIAISGPGTGTTPEAAYNNALDSMNKLQTILITGSLPFKLKVEKLDSISPLLGPAFIKNAIYIGLLALLSVGVVVYIRYRKLRIVIPMLFVMLCEVIIILGIASLIRWRLDLVAIAGIIAAVGTGVDDQIVIADEVLKGEGAAYNWKQRIKKAFFIIFTAYVTTFVALVPLWNAGAGLMRGFVLTTLIGITVGVLLTRPAFASLIETLLKE